MPLRRKVRSADSFNVLASWLQQPSHLVGERQLTKNSTGTTSLRFLSTAEDLLNVDRRSEPVTCPGRTSDISPSNSQTRKGGRPTHRYAHSLSEVSSRVWHPGVETLLTEYYKLLETSRPSASHSVAVRHRLSLMEHLFGALTVKLPAFLQLRTVFQKFETGLDFCTTESPTKLLVAIVILLQLMRFFYVSMGFPLVICLLLGSLGLLSLQRSERKYKASMQTKSKEISTLGTFEIGKQTNILANGAGSYRKIKSSNLSPTPLANLEWSSTLKQASVLESTDGSSPQDAAPLQNPPITMHSGTGDDTLEQDIRQIRVAILGPRDGNLPSSSNSNNTDWIIEAVQELCDVVGVERLHEDRTDIHSIRSKIQELRMAVGV